MDSMIERLRNLYDEAEYREIPRAEVRAAAEEDRCGHCKRWDPVRRSPKRWTWGECQKTGLERKWTATPPLPQDCFRDKGDAKHLFLMRSKGRWIERKPNWLGA
jgi:hypothetical protein